MHLYPSAIFLLFCQDYPSFGAEECLLLCGSSRLKNRCYKNTNHQYHSACDDLFSPASSPLLQETCNLCLLFYEEACTFLTLAPPIAGENNSGLSIF